MNGLSGFIALSFTAVVAASALTAASTSFVTAGPKYVIHIPQEKKPPIIHIPNGNGQSAGDLHIVLPRTPIHILDDGVGSQKPGPQTLPAVHSRPQSVQTAVECSVKAEGGSTNSLWIVNTGEVDLAAGTSIRFRVRSTGDHGAFQLNRSIRPGGGIEVPNLLHGAPGGTPCSVQIIG